MNQRKKLTIIAGPFVARARDEDAPLSRSLETIDAVLGGGGFRRETSRRILRLWAAVRHGCKAAQRFEMMGLVCHWFGSANRGGAAEGLSREEVNALTKP